MKSFKQYILEESTDANKHLTHLEELVLTLGKEGGVKSIQYIEMLLSVLNGHATHAINTTVKWDGAPAIVTGHDSEGKFFISTKSAFNVTPLLAYSHADIDEYFNASPELNQKLKIAFDSLKNVHFDGAYQGDLLYTHDSIEKSRVVNGEKYISFTPNTITYMIKSDSVTAKKILSSQIGVVFHTRYQAVRDLQGKVRFDNKQFGISVSHLKSNKAFIIDALFDNKSGSVSLTQNETNDIFSRMQRLKALIESINFEILDKKTCSLINIFLNSKIRQGDFISTPKNALSEFKVWVSGRFDTEIAKLKRKQTKEEEKNNFIQKISQYSQSYINMFEFINAIKLIKDVFISKYNEILRGSEIGTYIILPSGDIQITNPEGFVAFDQYSNSIKLVDRLEFSRANFILPKKWSKTLPDENI